MNVLVERAALEDVADALREVYADEMVYLPSEMADAIREAADIEPELAELEVTAPGTYIPPEGISGFNYILVDIDEEEVDPDDYQLVNKTFTSNGTHLPSEYGYYGFNKVKVKVAVKGKDEDGDDAIAYVDTNDGNKIKTEKIPVSIAVTKEPDKTTYNDGESINLSGIVVKAYCSNGTEWGTVPVDELTIEPTVARADSIDEYSDGEGVNALLMTVVSGVSASGSMLIGDKVLGYFDYYNTHFDTVTIRTRHAELGDTFLVTRYNGIQYIKVVSGNGFNVDLAAQENGVWDRVSSSTWHPTNNGKFSGSSLYATAFVNAPESTSDPTDAGEMVPAGGSQTILVKWTNLYTDEILTTDFEILVES